MSPIGDSIRQLREQAQLSREAVAGFADLSVDDLAQIEAGVRPLEPYELFDLAAALGVDTHALLTYAA